MHFWPNSEHDSWNEYSWRNLEKLAENKSHALTSWLNWCNDPNGLYGPQQLTSKTTSMSIVIPPHFVGSSPDKVWSCSFRQNPGKTWTTLPFFNSPHCSRPTPSLVQKGTFSLLLCRLFPPLLVRSQSVNRTRQRAGGQKDRQPPSWMSAVQRGNTRPTRLVPGTAGQENLCPLPSP